MVRGEIFAEQRQEEEKAEASPEDTQAMRETPHEASFNQKIVLCDPTLLRLAPTVGKIMSQISVSRLCPVAPAG